MKKKTQPILFFPAAVLSLFILSCSSVPVSRTDQGTLLVIPAAQENDGSNEWFGNYRITVRNTGTGTLRRYLLPNDADFFSVTDLAPGRYEIIAERFVRKSIRIYPSISTRQNYYERNIQFELSAGKWTILDFCSETVMENGTMDKRWVQTIDTCRRDIEALLEKNPDFSAW